MLKIGITGSIGSGKSFVANTFSALEVPVYHADFQAKEMLDRKGVVRQLTSVFGNSILDENARINRTALADQVFGDPGQLEILNKLIHPLVISDFECWTALFRAKPYVMMEAAIILERGYYPVFDRIVLVTAPENIRLDRVMKRDSITEKQFYLRAAHQWKEEEKMKWADDIIVNDDVHPLLPQILSIHQKILDLL